MCVLLCEYMTCDMYAWLMISWKRKVVFPLHSVSVLRCRSSEKHIFHYHDGYVWIFGYLICLIYLMCKLWGGFRHIFVVVFGVDFCRFDEIQGGGWQLEARKSFGTCQDWGPLPAMNCWWILLVGRFGRRVARSWWWPRALKTTPVEKKTACSCPSRWRWGEMVKYFIWRAASNMWSWKLNITGSAGDAILNEDIVVRPELLPTSSNWQFESFLLLGATW